MGPTQPIATRPLAIQKDGTWYCYGWDLTKNICEIYSTGGYIHTVYTYPPYGEVTASGNVTQPIQWSSEYADMELGLVYYNYLYYNPYEGRWLSRDPIANKQDRLLCFYCRNSPVGYVDLLGLLACCSGEIATYDSADAAAQAAIREWNPISIEKNREYGGYICGCQESAASQKRKYFYTQPNEGGNAGVTLGGTECPNGTSTEADWHTHGAYDPDYDSEHFSETDKRSNDIQGIPGYLGTPEGTLQKYDPPTKTVEQLEP